MKYYYFSIKLKNKKILYLKDTEIKNLNEEVVSAFEDIKSKSKKIRDLEVA
jgi:hypothetical protein